MHAGQRRDHRGRAADGCPGERRGRWADGGSPDAEGAAGQGRQAEDRDGDGARAGDREAGTTTAAAPALDLLDRRPGGRPGADDADDVAEVGAGPDVPRP